MQDAASSPETMIKHFLPENLNPKTHQIRIFTRQLECGQKWDIFIKQAAASTDSCFKSLKNHTYRPLNICRGCASLCFARSHARTVWGVSCRGHSSCTNAHKITSHKTPLKQQAALSVCTVTHSVRQHRARHTHRSPLWLCGIKVMNSMYDGNTFLLSV